jgi:hypothetical protein
MACSIADCKRHTRAPHGDVRFPAKSAVRTGTADEGHEGTIGIVLVDADYAATERLRESRRR